MKLKRSRLLLIVSIVAVLCTGFVLGAAASKGRSDQGDQDSQKNSVTRSQEYYDSLELFGRVYERITRNYVDELDPEDLINSAIDGMLDKLDAHSQLLTPESYDDLMTSTQGEFGGLGIQITLRDGWITVVSPIEGTPAYLMGIQGGDQIVEIEGESTKGWKTNDAVSKLRGPKGTEVTIGIRRAGEDTIRHYTITRDIIKLESIPYVFMIDEANKVGYVRITNFARTTADELRTAVEKLEKQGMERLLIDLRFNPGGLLTAAKDVSGLFLKQGELIVYTKGRYMRNNLSYYATDGDEVDWSKTPLLLLVNGSSASASEIFSGAMQDHDVGLIAGQTTFGKGSVQTVFDLPPDKALKLTTARYYTPSGRSIHRKRTRDGELVKTHADSLAMEADADSLSTQNEEVEHHSGEVYFTDMGRQVYGGGGITPDVEIKPTMLSDAEVCLERDGIFFTFATDYAVDHKTLPKDFKVSSALLDKFYEMASKRENLKKYLKEFDLSWNRKLMDDNLDYVKTGITRELQRHFNGSEAAYHVSIKDDGQLWEAVHILSQAKDKQDLFRLAEQYRAKKLAEGDKSQTTAEVH